MIYYKYIQHDLPVFFSQRVTRRLVQRCVYKRQMEFNDRIAKEKGMYSVSHYSEALN